jgi:hypothetical protein
VEPAAAGRVFLACFEAHRIASRRAVEGIRFFPLQRKSDPPIRKINLNVEHNETPRIEG